MGSAAVYQLAKRAKKVLGLDQFSPPHDNGSSHGESRIIRQAIGEGEEYVPLVLRSYELWREIEKATGWELLTITGGLTFSGGGIANSGTLTVTASTLSDNSAIQGGGILPG